MQSLIQRWLERLTARRDGLRSASPALLADAQSCLAQGNAALGAGQLAEAAGHYRAAIALAPRHAPAYVNLAYVLLEQGNAAGAEQELETALAIAPDADAHYLQGQARAARGDWPKAQASYREALALRNDFAHAWRDLGGASEQGGDSTGALHAYRQAVRLAPEFIDALGGVARMHLSLGKPEEGLAAAREWTERAADDWRAHLVHAQLLSAGGRRDEALGALEPALRIAGENPILWQTRGNVLFASDRLPEALVAYERAVELAPDWAEARLNLGVARSRRGDTEGALVDVKKALELQPGYPMALYNLALLLLDLDRLDDALGTMQHACELHPQDQDVRWHFGISHLLAGRFDQGWPAFEARWTARSTGAPLQKANFAQPQWRGEPVQGRTILLHPEQGLGDTLQFVRYVPLLEQRGGRVLLWVPPSLEALARTVSPTCRVSSRLEDLSEFDLHCPLLSLPLAFDTSVETIPAQVPYLRSGEALRARWRERLGDKKGLRVGIVWSGNPAHANDRNRSIPLEEFATIAAPGCQFVSLQNAVREQDRAALERWEGLLHFGNELATFGDTAAVTELVDIVVSVDTSVVHLAGALARPLYVLLPARADWRWMLKREDSPWYPTARLFRQSARGAWHPVLQMVREELVRSAEER